MNKQYTEEQIQDKMLKLFKDKRVKFNFNLEYIEFDEEQGHIYVTSIDDVMKAGTRADITIIKDQSFHYLNGNYWCNYDRSDKIHNERLRFVG